MLKHLWCSDEPRATLDSQNSPWPGLGGSHHLPPYSVFYTSPWGPHPNGFLSRDSQRRVPKLPRLELSQLCGPITMCSDLQSGWDLKQSFSFRGELFNSLSHATYTHGVRLISDFLTPDLSFCHNLCCRCPNGSCKPILDIYTSITFQWYKKLLDARCFDLYNCSLKVQESTETPTPKMGSSLGSVSLHLHTISHFF
jgi:hypothetical protein